MRIAREKKENIKFDENRIKKKPHRKKNTHTNKLFEMEKNFFFWLEIVKDVCYA